jgi:hypothetical protein
LLPFLGRVMPTSAMMTAARAGSSAMAPNLGANRPALSRPRICPIKQQQLSLLPTYDNRRVLRAVYGPRPGPARERGGSFDMPPTFGVVEPISVR